MKEANEMTEAERIINIYNDTGNNLEFTVHMAGLEKNNPQLFYEIIALLNTGNYQIKYLNTTGTSI